MRKRFTQATDMRGCVIAKVRHGEVYITLDVPNDDVLLDWAATPFKPLPGCAVFCETKGGAARETLPWEAGNCVSYREEFHHGSLTEGSYVCHLVIAAPKFTMTPGGPPSPLVAPTPRDYAYVPPPLADFAKPLPSKAQRYDARRSLMARAQGKLKTTPNPAAQTALTRLTRDNVAVERAKLSEHVYYSQDKPMRPAPEGWHMLNAKELARRGVTPAMLNDPNSGFKAALYESSFERPPKLVMACAGTEDFFGADGLANLRQGLGLETKQYDRAMKLAEKVAQKNGLRDFDITGHSLGGGLASAGAAVTGAKGYTFNAAGLNPQTVARAPYRVSAAQMAARGQLIDAYHSAADPLTNLQAASGTPQGDVLPRALGVPHTLTPAAQWQHKWQELASRHPLDASGQMAKDGHGVDPQLVDHIEAEKDQDTATLTKFTAPAP